MICTSFRDFNLHFPHRRWRLRRIHGLRRLEFQSTPSLQKVTGAVHRAPRLSLISIHTFLTEGDTKRNIPDAYDQLFQSTPSSQKVTLSDDSIRHMLKISIHTFLTEGDSGALPTSTPISGFQSTPSSQKVTEIGVALFGTMWISIHTFLTEGDLSLPTILLLQEISIHTFLTEGDSNSPQHLPHSRPLSLTILYNILQQNQ